jgi:ribosomal protein S18 acetylase RimI-like enzyme
MAKNEHALGLYENFGFTIAYVVPIYSLSLRQPHASP